MNFLAHTLLSCRNEEMLIGNFMADFINNKEAENLPTGIYQGVVVHKRIDSFTDAHPSVLQSIKLLRPNQAKYAPVTVDILFDYFLTQRWSDYSQESLPDFTQRIYKTLEAHMGVYPPSLQEKIPRMIKNNFLYSCENIERLIETFAMVAKRAKFENGFSVAHIDLIKNEEALSGHFDVFFPELVSHIGDYCDCN
jgi:acyl carrier protein phosphodiesterase